MIEPSNTWLISVRGWGIVRVNFGNADPEEDRTLRVDAQASEDGSLPPAPEVE